MTNQIHAADGTPDPDLPTTVPDDAEPPPRPSDVPAHLRPKIARLEARVETLMHERNMWRARAHENSLHIERQKQHLDAVHRAQRAARA